MTPAGPLPTIVPVVEGQIVPVASGRRWLAGASIVWLVVTFPLLTFPEMLWPDGRLVAAGVAIVTAALAVALLAGWRPFDYLTALLVALVALGWMRVSGEKEALTHFSGVAVGLLAMAVVATWCTTRQRLGWGALVFLLAGLTALTLGLAGTTTAPFKLIALHPSSLPELKLGLPGLPANGWVNPNALGGTALMIVPLAVAMLLVPGGQGLARSLRVLAGTTALVGVAAIIIGQARTVWLATWLTAMVGVLWSVRNRRRRLVLAAAILAAPVLFLAAIRGSDAVAPERIWSEGRFAFAFRAEYVWAQGIEQLRTSPWLGIGLNHFRHVYQSPQWVREGVRESAHAHNIWLQTALDIGLVGLAGYVALLAALLRLSIGAVRDRRGFERQIALGCSLGILGVHLFGIADAVSLGARVGLFQWVAAGFLLAVSRPAASAGAAPVDRGAVVSCAPS
jgi:putative inorganic carbon (HCO3(-)) transporter